MHLFRDDRDGREVIKKSLDKTGVAHSTSSVNKPITLISNPPKPSVTPKKNK